MTIDKEQYRKDVDALLHQLNYKEVWGWVDSNVSDKDIPELPSYETLRNASQFLSDLTSMHYVELPSLHFVGTCVEFWWDMKEDKSMHVIFYPENEWTVTMEKKVVSGDGPEPSFEIDEDDGSKTPYFYLKEKFTKEIEKQQSWSKEYEPRMNMRIMWSTGYWDGPLSGYCTQNVGNDTFFFDCVEELPYSPGTRMYAVYELSTWEQVKACLSHAKWTAVVHSKILWCLYLCKWKHSLALSYDAMQKKREKWKAKHKLIGYFTR